MAKWIIRYWSEDHYRQLRTTGTIAQARAEALEEKHCPFVEDVRLYQVLNGVLVRKALEEPA